MDELRHRLDAAFRAASEQVSLIEHSVRVLNSRSVRRSDRKTRKAARAGDEAAARLQAILLPVLEDTRTLEVACAVAEGGDIARLEAIDRAATEVRALLLQGIALHDGNTSREKT